MKIAVKPAITSSADGHEPQELPVSRAEHAQRAYPSYPALHADRLATLDADSAPSGGRRVLVHPDLRMSLLRCRTRSMDDERPPRLSRGMWMRFAIAGVLIVALSGGCDGDRGAQHGQRASPKRMFPKLSQIKVAEEAS